MKHHKCSSLGEIILMFMREYEIYIPLNPHNQLAQPLIEQQTFNVIIYFCEKDCPRKVCVFNRTICWYSLLIQWKKRIFSLFLCFPHEHMLVNEWGVRNGWNGCLMLAYFWILSWFFAILCFLLNKIQF